MWQTVRQLRAYLVTGPIVAAEPIVHAEPIVGVEPIVAAELIVCAESIAVPGDPRLDEPR